MLEQLRRPGTLQRSFHAGMSLVADREWRGIGAVVSTRL